LWIALRAIAASSVLMAHIRVPVWRKW
jgi:hypothetical protein